MTVREADGETIKCDWFDKEGRLRNAAFFAAELKQDSGTDEIRKLLDEIEIGRKQQMESGNVKTQPQHAGA